MLSLGSRCILHLQIFASTGAQSFFWDVYSLSLSDQGPVDGAWLQVDIHLQNSDLLVY